MTTDLVGRRLGEFEIVRELGRGGMGVVYEAVQTSLNRRVALKVLGPGLGLTPSAVDRFRREAAAAAKLHHTNIVPVYATGEQDGVHYYAMELIDGPSLDAVIRQLRNGPSADTRTELPGALAATGAYVPADPTPPPSGASSGLTSDSGYFDRVVAVIADVADALHHAHQSGVTHRDVKPSNLLLSADGRLSVTDFGLARMLEQPGMTVTGEFVGTPAYMSPEQVTAGRIPVDHRTDVYSLGVTLYELLTLRPPFAADGRDRLLAMVIQKDPAPPRSVNPRVPRDLETICLKCLEKDPDRRYPTAKELADDLRRYVHRFAIRAKRTGPLGRARKWVRRNPAVAALGLAVLLAVAAAGGFAWQARKSEHQRRADERRRADEDRARGRDDALDRAVTAALNGRPDEAEREIAAAEALGVPAGEVRKVRGVIALVRGDPAAAVPHLELAAAGLGPSPAVTALLARAHYEAGDMHRAEAYLADARATGPRTADDHLFLGQVVSLFDTPAAGLALTAAAVRLRDSPLARLAQGEAQAMVAMDTGSVADAEAAVRAADLARELLPGSDQALAVCLTARLVARDVYRDGGDDARVAIHREAADGLVRDAGHRANKTLLLGCVYFHLSEPGHGGPAAVDYARRVWEASGVRVSGVMLASLLHRAGDARGAVGQFDAVRARGMRGIYMERAYAMAELGEAERNAGFGDARQQLGDPGYAPLKVATIPLLLGRPDEARQIYADLLSRNVLPAWHGGWPRTLAEFGAGLRDERWLRGQAGASRLLLCEAHYAIALRRLTRGDRDGARTAFEECARTRAFLYGEHHHAGLFLARMGKESGWPGWIPGKK